MIKKIIITGSLMLTICVLTKMFGYSYFVAKNKQTNLDVSNAKETLNDNYYLELNFANELIPIESKRVDAKMKKALKAHSYRQLQTLKLHQRAEVWFPIIEPILKKFGIPEDFKYVPLIESGMKGGQYSSKGAAGLWQFMPETGRNYGLTVNKNIDERLNVRLSTIAAAKYLKDLHKQFNSWTLAAAAYNGGEGRIWKQIKLQQQDSYYKLKLNHETGKYLYSLISMKEVIEHPEKHGYRIHNARKLVAFNN